MPHRSPRCPAIMTTSKPWMLQHLFSGCSMPWIDLEHRTKERKYLSNVGHCAFSFRSFRPVLQSPPPFSISTFARDGWSQFLSQPRSNTQKINALTYTTQPLSRVPIAPPLLRQFTAQRRHSTQERVIRGRKVKELHAKDQFVNLNIPDTVSSYLSSTVKITNRTCKRPDIARSCWRRIHRPDDPFKHDFRRTDRCRGTGWPCLLIDDNS